MRRSRLGREFARFRFPAGLQFRQRMHFARPILVFVLPEGIQEREERIGIRYPGGGRRVRARDANLGDIKLSRRLGIGNEQENLRDVGWIHRARTARTDRVPAHAEQLPVQPIIVGAPQRHGQQTRLTGIQREGTIDTMPGAIRAGIIHPAMQGRAVGPCIPNRHCHARVRRQIPMPIRRGQRHARPSLPGTRGEPEHGSLRRWDQAEPGIVGRKSGELGCRVEVEQNPVRGPSRHRAEQCKKQLREQKSKVMMFKA